MKTKEPDSDQRGGKSDGDGDNKGSVKGKRTLPNTKGNEAAIIARIENKLGPVGKGHHNSHRTEALRKWLEKKQKSKQ